MGTLVNLAANNVLWLAIVWSAFADLELLGLAALLAWLPIHFWRSPHRHADAITVAAAVLLGPLVDTLLIQTDMLRYGGHAPVAGFAPVFVVALWANFALMINHGLSWLHQRPLLAALAGAGLAPLAYLGGVRIGAAEFIGPPAQALALLAAGWAVVLPLLASIGSIATRRFTFDIERWAQLPPGRP